MSGRSFHASPGQLNVCPWQYTICELPAGEVCQIRKTAQTQSDITKWEKAVYRAGSCPGKGEKLNKREYENRRHGALI